MKPAADRVCLRPDQLFSQGHKICKQTPLPASRQNVYKVFLQFISRPVVLCPDLVLVLYQPPERLCPISLMENGCLNYFKDNGQSYFRLSCETSISMFSNFGRNFWIIFFLVLYILQHFLCIDAHVKFEKIFQCY